MSLNRRRYGLRRNAGPLPAGVDAIGGVDFDVPYPMDYHDPAQNLVIEQAPGLRHLSGDDAMQVIRWRKNNGEPSPGDVGRIQIQQDFLSAVLDKCSSQQPC
mgnify:CR=1 FL=1